MSLLKCKNLEAKLGLVRPLSHFTSKCFVFVAQPAFFTQYKIAPHASVPDLKSILVDMPHGVKH